jgi:PAS domain S-box-containing protein
MGGAGTRRSVREMRQTPVEELRTLLSRVPAMIGYWDRDLRNRLANDAYLEFFGVTPEAMRGLHIRELLGPALYQLNLPHIRRALAGEEQLFDREIPLPSGDTRYTQASYVPDTVDGEVRGFFVLVTDISARRRAEVALADAERRFRTLFESAPDAVVIVGADAAIRLVNAQAEAMFGYPRAALVGRPVDALVPERFRERHAAHRGGYLADPHVRPMGAGLELRARRRDGSEFPVEVSLSPLESDEGLLVSVSVRDVSERRAAERTAQQLAAIVESSDSAIIAETGDGTIVTWNAAAERIYGYTAEEAIGRGSTLLARAGDAPDLEARLEQVRRGESTGPFETVHVTKDGSLIDVEVEIAPIRGGGGRIAGASTIARDITVAKREQEALERKLIESQKLEALGVLAGGIAHDFNNLLGVVLGHTSLALTLLPDASPVRDMLEQVRDAARHSAELADQMLAYSGKGRFVVQPMALPELVQGLAELIPGTISTKAALTTDFAADTPAIEGDVTQLRQVVLNLITNAAEALEAEGGTIGLSTGAVDADRAYLSGFASAEELPAGRYAFLEVHDSGPGMSAETRARIFDPFFTTKFTGRGLGLAAVQGIVRSHRGAIKLSSEPGHGTSFKLLFPAASEPPRATVPTAPEPGDWRGSGTVLVADDSDGIRRMARVMLESMGFDVLEAADGTEALELLTAHDGELAFALIDVMMPGMTGSEVVAELERLGATTSVVLSSGYNPQQVAQAGFAEFLQKPYELKHLRAVAKRMIDRR